MNKQINETIQQNVLGGLAMTVGISIAMAIAFDDISVGIGIGVAIGMSFFLALNSRQNLDK